MRQSESIAMLAAALVKAQAEAQNATKDSENPFYRSSYASLNAVLDTIKPVLANHGLAILQLPGMDGTNATLENVLLHESGEWIAGIAGAPMPPKETKDGPKAPDAQSMGSAITYLRRYSLAALMGITQEDDDGNEASNSAGKQEKQASKQQNKSATEDSSDMIPCPKCGGPCWDNRVNKKNPKGPDLKCKNKECDHAIWLGSWRDDLLKEIAAAHDVEAIDAQERKRAEDAVGTLIPAKMDSVRKWLADLAQNAGA